MLELDTWVVFDNARAALRQQYDEDRWRGQLYYPLFIVEKDTMQPVCRPMTRRWQMPFASSRGYGSHQPLDAVSQGMRLIVAHGRGHDRRRSGGARSVH
jgi:hypothetical protein